MPYVPPPTPVSPGGAGVITFNGRSGAVDLLIADMPVQVSTGMPRWITFSDCTEANDGALPMATLKASDRAVWVDPTGGSFAVQLVGAQNFSGVVRIKHVADTANLVYVQTQSDDVIMLDVAHSYEAVALGQSGCADLLSITLLSDSINWQIT